jgi:hypothetical protein
MKELRVLDIPVERRQPFTAPDLDDLRRSVAM